MMEDGRLAELRQAIAVDDDERVEELVLQLTPDAEPALQSILNAGNADERWWAARALAHAGTQQSLPHLVVLLADEDAALRTVAAMALGALYPRSAATFAPYFAPLAARLTDEEGAVRQAAADALIQCGDGAIEVLTELLRSSPHEGARSRAAYALCKIGTPATVPALFRCLNDPNYLVHTYAYETLDEMGLLENQLLI